MFNWSIIKIMLPCQHLHQAQIPNLFFLCSILYCCSIWKPITWVAPSDIDSHRVYRSVFWKTRKTYSQLFSWDGLEHTKSEIQQKILWVIVTSLKETLQFPKAVLHLDMSSTMRLIRNGAQDSAITGSLPQPGSTLAAVLNLMLVCTVVFGVEWAINLPCTVGTSALIFACWYLQIALLGINGLDHYKNC